jgi:1,4-alpha-glucan branching enzyme
MKTLKRTKKTHRTVAGPAGQSVVHFEYVDSHADSVCVAGTFNGWHPSANPMKAVVHGHWRSDLVLQPGTYEYALVVDGRWKPDPQCGEKVENAFGGINSVLRVPVPGKIAADRQGLQ